MKENKLVRICRGQRNIEVKNNMIKDEHEELQRIMVFILGLKPIRLLMPAFQRIRCFHTRSSINQSFSISTFRPITFLVTRNSANQMISLLNFRSMEVFQAAYLVGLRQVPVRRTSCFLRTRFISQFFCLRTVTIDPFFLRERVPLTDSYITNEQCQNA